LNQTIRAVTITAQVHELSPALAQHELSASSLAPKRHFVDEEIERRRNAVADLDLDAVARGQRRPCG
jgi:hypothetical protein